MNNKSAWDFGTEQLRRAGVVDGRWEAELLLRHVTGLSRVCFLTHPTEELDEAAAERYRVAIRERSLGVPVQYIVGCTEFYGREFSVDSGVLIPRPDTEILVEEALRVIYGDYALQACPRLTHVGVNSEVRGVKCEVRGAKCEVRSAKCEVRSAKCEVDPVPFSLLDLCAGSGCVGLTLACEVPELNVWLTDVSRAALDVAQHNAERLGVRGRVEFRQGDLFAAVEGMRFALIVANPPYIPSKEISSLDAAVQREPRQALDGGEDGLAFYRRIASDVSGVLRPGGWLLLEIGCTQASAVETLLRAAHFTEITVRQDLAGRDRVIRGRTCQGTSLHT